MQPNIQPNGVARNTTVKEIPNAIVFGARRILRPSWAEVHALTIQGWAVQRIGSVLIAYYADIEEGTA